MMGDPSNPDRLPELAGHTRADGIARLDRAADIGLLTALGSGYYRIQPSLPWYFRQLYGTADPAATRRAEAAYCTSIARLGAYYQRQYRELPPEAERTVAVTGVVAEAEGRGESDRPGVTGTGTARVPVSFAGFVSNFSPMPPIAPPPLGRR